MRTFIASFTKKFKTMLWAISQAWKIDKTVLLLWLSLSMLVSVLPAVSLYYNREIIARLSEYLAYGIGSYAEIISPVILLGIIMTLIGLSARVNGDLIYMMMYDSYYIGMEELLMDSLQKVKITDLLKSELNDEYNFIVGRAGSLTDLMSGFCTIAGKIVSIVSLLYVAFQTSKIFFAISSLYIVLVLIMNFTFTEKIRWNAQKVRKDERIARYFEEMPLNPGLAKEIRIFENTDFVVSQWKKAYKNVINNENSRSFAMEVRNFASSMGFYLFLIVMVIYSLFQVAVGNMQVSVFVMLYSLCISILNTISGFANSIISFDYGLFALERQRDFLQFAPSVEGTKKEPAAAGEMDPTEVFSLENVCFSYQEGVPILKDISFRIAPGEVVALVGENGSGKTTLAKVLMGMYPPDSGTVKLFGKPLDAYTPDEIRAYMNVFFQDFCLIHAPIKENVSYGDIEQFDNEKLILDAVKKGGAGPVVRKLPDGIHTILGKKIFKEGVELSGGEKQRIGVSRAHMGDKLVLIFDEPAAALDPIAEMEQFMNIRNMLNDRTAVLISHRIGFARMADKIIMMDGGRIAEMGTHEELIDKDGLYAHFFREQAQWYQN